MTSLTRKDVEKLARRIDTLGNGINLADYLAALGMVVSSALQQYPEAEERLAATISWIETLGREMLNRYFEKKAN